MSFSHVSVDENDDNTVFILGSCRLMVPAGVDTKRTSEGWLGTLAVGYSEYTVDSVFVSVISFSLYLIRLSERHRFTQDDQSTYLAVL